MILRFPRATIHNQSFYGSSKSSNYKASYCHSRTLRRWLAESTHRSRYKSDMGYGLYVSEASVDIWVIPTSSGDYSYYNWGITPISGSLVIN